MRILGIMILCGISFSSLAAKKDKIKEVFIQTIQSSKVEQKSVYPVVVKSLVDSKIKSQIHGIVKTLNVKLGQKVTAGKTLLTLTQQGGEFDYRPLKVRAVVSGVVSDIKVNIGEYVNQGSLLVSIIDPKQLYGRIEIPVSDNAKIINGQITSMNFPQLPGKKYSGVIDGKAVAANNLTGTISANIGFTKGTQGLPPGVLGTATIQKGILEQIVLEETALRTEGEKTYVKVINKDNIASNKYITVGEKNGGKVIVKEGLVQGDQVIVRANGFVAKGDKVKVVRKD